MTRNTCHFVLVIITALVTTSLSSSALESTSIVDSREKTITEFNPNEPILNSHNENVLLMEDESNFYSPSNNEFELLLEERGGISSSRRRLSWWLLFWNAVGPHCHHHCHGPLCHHHQCHQNDNNNGGGGSSGGASYYNGNGGGGSGGSSSGGSSSGGSSSGGDSSSGGSSSSSGGAYDGSYYNYESDTTYTDNSEETSGNLQSATHYFAIAGATLASAVAIVTIYFAQKRATKTAMEHPLQGSLGRRMMLFSSLANKGVFSASRPERVVDIEMSDNDFPDTDYVRA